MITSVRNSKVKWVRSLQSRPRARQEEGAFVVEGVRLAEEALVAGRSARLVLFTSDLSPRGMAVVQGFAASGAETLPVAPEVMRSASDTRTPQGLLAVLPLLDMEFPQKVDFLLVLDEVRDPGNLGTVLRTAAAASVDVVLLTTGSADPLAPKVLRAGMGAHFRLPVQRMEWEQIAGALRRQADPSLHLYLAAPGAGVAFDRADFRRPLALILGGEAQGAGEQARGLADSCVHIPMPGGGESLNVAAAAAVFLFEVIRQRSAGP